MELLHYHFYSPTMEQPPLPPSLLTYLDPHPLSAGEREGLTGPGRPRTIREFDALITAPRLGFADVDAYYQACSPMTRLRQLLHPTPPTGAWRSPRLLLLHA